jgi:hypothetical protein
VALSLLSAGRILGRLLYVAIPHSTARWIPLGVTSTLAVLLLALMGASPGRPSLLIGVLAARGAQRFAIADL